MATAITVVCPHCSHRMRASSDFIGRKGRCPSCKNLVDIRPGGETLETIQITQTGQAAPHQRARAATTTVSGLVSGLIAVALTIVLYLVLFVPLRNTFFGELFVKRGPMPFLITLITCWGAAMLTLKMIKVRQQRSFADLELELIPLEIGMEITPDNVDQFLGHLAKLPGAQQTSILGRRIQGALEHFKSRRSVPEVQEYLATQAEIDASGVDGGYTLLRAFIWAIPILGFIGTVLGISTAVSGLDKAIGSGPPAAATAAADTASADAAEAGSTTSDRLMQGLGTVTAGLATAFDTTLVALVMAILLLFPTESLRRTEYGMLDGIENFANESLLRRMSDRGTGPSTEEMPDVVRGALDSAFREHQRWLAQWQAQVADLGQVIGADFETVVQRVQQRVTEADETRTRQFEELGRQLEGVFTQAAGAAQQWQQMDQNSKALSREFLEAVDLLRTTLSENARVCGQLSEQQDRLCALYSERDLGTTLASMAEQIGRLSDPSRQWPKGVAGSPAVPAGSGGSDGHGAAATSSSSEPMMEPEPGESITMLESIEPPSDASGRSGFFGRWLGRRS